MSHWGQWSVRTVTGKAQPDATEQLCRQTVPRPLVPFLSRHST